MCVLNQNFCYSVGYTIRLNNGGYYINASSQRSTAGFFFSFLLAMKCIPKPNCTIAKFCVVLSSNCTKYPEHGFVRMLQSAFSTLFIFVLFRRANKHFQLHKIHVATIRKSSVFANINTVSIISTKVFRLFYSVFFLKGNWQRFNSVYFNVFEWA